MRFFYFFIFMQVAFACSPTEKVVTPKDDCESVYDILTNQIVYTRVDEDPEYIGGAQGALIFFANNFKYPDQDFFQGSFHLEFIVDAQGYVRGQRIRNGNVDNLTEADKEALRVLSIMPKWKPGKCKGRAVPVRTYLPIRL